ncbi:MAG: hypothetical protein COA32_02710 [Fluviicola sp.]|nr:MAG: hypothetical protein COA32_02710 [Fluviicola sp.]
MQPHYVIPILEHNFKQNSLKLLTMATVFETRLIGNIGRDASVKTMDRGVVAINFPVAHNKNWRDKKTGESRTKTTWVNCTIWKKEGANMRILDFLKSGALVELLGTPFAKAYPQDDGTIKTEIRLNISKTNILRPSKSDSSENSDDNYDDDDSNVEDFTLGEDDF